MATRDDEEEDFDFPTSQIVCLSILVVVYFMAFIGLVAAFTEMNQ